MTWALIFFVCIGKDCTPEYVETYSSRAECVKHVKNTAQKCLPVSKD